MHVSVISRSKLLHIVLFVVVLFYVLIVLFYFFSCGAAAQCRPWPPHS